MALTTLLITIDINGLTVALPTIGRDLNASTTDLQWALNAYLLASAAPTVAAGRLADIFGRRRMLLIGTVVFAAASAAWRRSRRPEPGPPRGFCRWSG
jgi:MFS family permease